MISALNMSGPYSEMLTSCRTELLKMKRKRSDLPDNIPKMRQVLLSIMSRLYGNLDQEFCDDSKYACLTTENHSKG